MATTESAHPGAQPTTELPVQPEGADTTAPKERFRPSAAGWAARYAVAIGVLAFVFLLPLIVPDEAAANLIISAAIFACVALSMNMLTGYLGQLSLGHQAFFGIGAFVAATLVTTYKMPFVVAVVAGGLSGAFAAIILGGVALRIRGLYLAIVTLAYGLLAENSLFLIRGLTGGGAGVPANRPAGFTGNRAYAYICLAVLALLFTFDWRFMKSKAGRAVLAIRDDEKVAATFGINITGYKLLAFVLSGIYAGLAGSLFAFQIGNVVAAPFNLALALTFVLMAVVGGLGNRVGVIIGGAFFAIIDTVLELVHNLVIWIAGLIGIHLGHGLDPTLAPVIGAALLVLTLIGHPGGIGQQIAPIQNWVRGDKFTLHAAKDASAVKGGTSVGRP
jgi:branched-chain amino acid transport system permease protein